jgi:hypothetical protein
MRSGFAHFDQTHRENFCAAVLLLTMEVDDLAKQAVADLVRGALGISAPCELVSFGREARLATREDEPYARVDLWLLFRSSEPFYAFVEVKTHDQWDAASVAAQVRDQATRPRLVSSKHAIRGSVLLAPDRLCDRVRAADGTIPTLPWAQLLRTLKLLPTSSQLTQHAIRHLEENVDRPTGIADRTLNDFEHATTTVACLRQFLKGCIAEVEGTRLTGFNTTPGDGEPLRWSGWAWYGVSVPFTLDEDKYRLGIYKYVSTPPGEESARDVLWLEAYAGDDPNPVAFLKFDPPTLAPPELDKFRAEFKREWSTRRSATV